MAMARAGKRICRGEGRGWGSGAEMAAGRVKNGDGRWVDWEFITTCQYDILGSPWDAKQPHGQRFRSGMELPLSKLESRKSAELFVCGPVQAMIS